MRRFMSSTLLVPYTTMVAKVQSEDDLLKLLEVTEKEQIISHVAEADGYSFAQINKRALLAFTLPRLWW